MLLNQSQSGKYNNWVETVHKSSKKVRESKDSRRWFPAAGDSSHWRVDLARDSSQGAVTAGPVFCQDRRFFSHRLTGLSVPSTLHYCTWLTAAGMKKKKKTLLTAGFYTDVPAEGLMFQSLCSLGPLFCHKNLDWWETKKTQPEPLKNAIWPSEKCNNQSKSRISRRNQLCFTRWPAPVQTVTLRM